MPRQENPKQRHKVVMFSYTRILQCQAHALCMMERLNITPSQRAEAAPLEQDGVALAALICVS